jgi:hypothetical protein
MPSLSCFLARNFSQNPWTPWTQVAEQDFYSSQGLDTAWTPLGHALDTATPPQWLAKEGLDVESLRGPLTWWTRGCPVREKCGESAGMR